jgi:membrane protein required for colicin V production
MIIDILYVVAGIFALLRGFKRGLIVGLFSLVAVIIGLAAALKLSAVVAGYIGKAVKVSEAWLPLVSFIVVFIIVILLVRLGANAIEKIVELAMLGWLNRVGGMLLYLVLYTIVFSVLLFYAEQMHLIKPETIQSSRLYSFIQPWGPEVINGLGRFLPFFKNLFVELQDFFEKVAEKI